VEQKLFACSQCAVIENITFQSGNVNNKPFCLTAQAGSTVCGLSCGCVVKIF
jgi:hypothetical protein